MSFLQRVLLQCWSNVAKHVPGTDFQPPANDLYAANFRQCNLHGSIQWCKSYIFPLSPSRYSTTLFNYHRLLYLFRWKFILCAFRGSVLEECTGPTSSHGQTWSLATTTTRVCTPCMDTPALRSESTPPGQIISRQDYVSIRKTLIIKCNRRNRSCLYLMQQ